MNAIRFERDELWIENIKVSQVAKTYPTPFYIYSKRALLENIKQWKAATRGLDALICFALKANDNIHLLQILRQQGAGADVVSGGELYVALKAGVPPEKIVFAGVGKQEFEIEMALKKKIRALNVESEEELLMVQNVAEKIDCVAPVQLRINPDIDAKSHPYITTGLTQNKFGIESSRAMALFKLAEELTNIRTMGIHVHIGSQIVDLSPFRECSRAVRRFYERLQNENIPVSSIDLGGGLGIDYKQVVEWPGSEQHHPIPGPQDYVSAILSELKDLPVQFIFEPGRSLVANTGILVTRVLYTKKTSRKKFLIVDSGMNDLVRPSLYQAYHRILPISHPVREGDEKVDVVGPICETADFFARDRQLPAIRKGELLAVFSAGAYGYSLASNYNGRPRRAELLVDGDRVILIRRPETFEDLLKLYDEELLNQPSDD